MLTEDYLMRMINPAVAALLKAIGLKKAGKYEEARQAIDQAFEQLTGVPANVLKQLDDASLLTTLTAQGQLDTGRLAVMADLFKEEGEILDRQGLPVAGYSASTRALRFLLEIALADDINLSSETIRKIEALYTRLKEQELPVETRLALFDYYGRLLGRGEQELAAARISRKQISAALAKLQDQLGPLLSNTDR